MTPNPRFRRPAPVYRPNATDPNAVDPNSGLTPDQIQQAQYQQAPAQQYAPADFSFANNGPGPGPGASYYAPADFSFAGGNANAAAYGAAEPAVRSAQSAQVDRLRAGGYGGYGGPPPGGNGLQPGMSYTDAMSGLGGRYAGQAPSALQDGYGGYGGNGMQPLPPGATARGAMRGMEGRYGGPPPSPGMGVRAAGRPPSQQWQDQQFDQQLRGRPAAYGGPTTLADVRATQQQPGGYGIQGFQGAAGGYENAMAARANNPPGARDARYQQQQQMGPRAEQGQQRQQQQQRQQYQPPPQAQPQSQPAYQPQSQPSGGYYGASGAPQSSGPQPYGGVVNSNASQYRAGGSFDATGTGAGYAGSGGGGGQSGGFGGGSGATYSNASAMSGSPSTPRMNRGFGSGGFSSGSSGYGGGGGMSRGGFASGGMIPGEDPNSPFVRAGEDTDSESDTGNGDTGNGEGYASGGYAPGGPVYQPAPGFPGFQTNQANPVNPVPDTQNPADIQNTQTTSNYIQPNLRDQFDMNQNNRAAAAKWGQSFDQTMAGNADYSTGLARGYDQLTPELYGPIWAGEGGYTPEQAAEIRGNTGPTGLPQIYDKSQSQMAGNFLSPEEMAAASGNPNVGYQMYSGQVPKIEATNATGASAVTNNVSSMRDAYGNAIRPNELSLNPDYASNQQKIVNAGVSQMQDVANNPDLGVTSQFTNQAGMTDEEVRQMAQARAAEVGGNYRTAQEKLEQDARASGTVNPLGIAAARQSNQYNSAEAMGDALNRGELEARQAQRNAATNVEQTRLGARQYQSGMQQDVARGGMQAQQANTAQTEAMRLGAAQDLSGRQMTAAGDVGRTGVSAAEYNATNANDIAAATSKNLADYAASGENTQANRAYTLGANRQQANTAAQQTGFNQGMAVNEAASGRGTTIANQQQGQQAEGRQASMGMQQYYGGQGNQANQLRLGGQQVAGNQVQAATSGYGTWGTEQDASGFGSNFEKSVGSALGKSLGTIGGTAGGGKPASYTFGGGGGGASGGMISGPTGSTAPASSVMITPDGNYHPVGEDGPEMIVPLAPNRQGTWEYQPDRGGMGRSPTSGPIRSPFARPDYQLDQGPGSHIDPNHANASLHDPSGCGDMGDMGDMGDSGDMTDPRMHVMHISISPHGRGSGGMGGGDASGGIIGTDDSDPDFSGRSPLSSPYASLLRRSLGYAAGGVVPGPKEPTTGGAASSGSPSYIPEGYGYRKERTSPTGSTEYIYPAGYELSSGIANTYPSFNPQSLPVSSYREDWDIPSTRTHERIHQAQYGLSLPDENYTREIFRGDPGDATRRNPTYEIPAYGLDQLMREDPSQKDDPDFTNRKATDAYDQSRYDLYLRALRDRNPNGPTYRMEVAVPERIARKNIMTQPPPYPQPPKPQGLDGQGYAAGGIIPGIRDPQPLRVAMGHIEMPSATISRGGNHMSFHPPHPTPNVSNLNPNLTNPSKYLHGRYHLNAGKALHLPGGSSHFSEMGSLRSPAYG